MATRKLRKRRTKRTFKFVLFICLGLLATVGVAVASQEQKLNEIIEEQEELTQEYVSLQNESERLERMIEYAQSDEYKLQYAREHLGYVKPDDIKFDLGD